MAYIYKITNLINGKSYIGKTLKTVEERYNEHLRDSRKKVREKRPLYSAMKKYGSENFKVEIIEECEPKNLNNREIFWINYYNTFREGYNATLGGDGKAYYDGAVIIKLWQQGKTVKEIAELYGCCTDTVITYLYDYGISKEEINKRKIKAQSKPVYQIDLATGKILNQFYSANEAARCINNPHGYTHILDVCHHRRKSAYGYFWQFVNELDAN